jgi:hypothetical protein
MLSKEAAESGDARLIYGLRATWSGLSFGLARAGFGLASHTSY